MVQQRKKQLLCAGLCAIALGGYQTQAMATRLPVASVQQQVNKITGVITDAEGPVIGASIKVKDSKEAAVTDIDGNFTINAQKGQVLVITYIGSLVSR